MAIGKVAAHLCLTLIIKELRINVEHDRVVTTLNIIFSIVGTYEPPSPPYSLCVWTGLSLSTLKFGGRAVYMETQPKHPLSLLTTV